MECRIKINIKGKIKMKKLIFIYCLLIAAVINIQPETQDPLVLNYVANMGVLLSSGDSKVLIDTLFDKTHPSSRTPAPETIESIMKGEQPFKDVDLVLVTHNHPDHFDAALAVRYLEIRPEPILVAPADAASASLLVPEGICRIRNRCLDGLVTDGQQGDRRRYEPGYKEYIHGHIDTVGETPEPPLHDKISQRPG
jgi:glyoxylase-like metal-dependent hydrolase (beta-lactamase superfamily II)